MQNDVVYIGVTSEQKGIIKTGGKPPVFIVYLIRSANEPHQVKLCFSDSAYRTLSCARSTIDAFSFVDYELSVSHRDSAYWALSFTRTTADARITNTICHSK